MWGDFGGRPKVQDLVRDAGQGLLLNLSQADRCLLQPAARQAQGDLRWPRCGGRAGRSTQGLGREWGRAAGQDPGSGAHTCQATSCLCLVSVGHRGLNLGSSGTRGSDPAEGPCHLEPSGERRPIIVGACYCVTMFLPRAG